VGDPRGPLACAAALACALAVSCGARSSLLNCDGKVGTFDPDTGQARIFSTTTVQVYGADRLP